MAQTFHHQQDTAVEFEKLGVIAGFLTGLALALGYVYEPIVAAGLPEWAGMGAAIAAVALCTRAGLAISRRFGHDAR
ncbi:MAG TPA: hypothetical protein VFH49_09380 [Aquabacterium sp.]|nr:hypothetical protein [Aquabacterium sp.]